jgi:hypothetical protein
MKSHARSPFALALAAIAILGSATAQDNNGIALELNQKGGKARRAPLEERRIPAFQRIEAQLTPYVYEGRPLMRNDETSSNVLSVHVLASGGKAQLRAGHSLAPNLHRIAQP